ncbi:hypothetical protein N7540_008846 [Penicillium herquei]|nr:hypothetical protein N7540_008846 [Penicillium herquei]
MKILCLHGFGTDVHIMKQQMATLFKYCNPQWRFVFLEPKLECQPAYGATKYPPPYSTWSTELDPTSIRASCDLVKEAFEEQGPFDGVFCYSLGGSLQPEDLQRLRSADLEQLDLLPEPARTSVRNLIHAAGYLESTLGRTRKELLDRPLEDIPCVLHHDFYPARLPIPTLHAHSKNDPPILRLSAELAQEFCDPTWRVSYEHSVVHGIPRFAAEVEGMVAAMELVVSKVQQARL